MQASQETPPSDPITPEQPTQAPEPDTMAEPSTMPEQAPDLITMPEPPAPPAMASAAEEKPAPSGSASPFSRIMRGSAAQDAGAAQRDLLADLPPPPINEPLTADDDTGLMRRRRRNRMLLAGALAIIVVALGAWLWSGGEDSEEVPVITAEATPEKVKPADGGGLEVPNQNVQVLENMDGATPQPEAETVLPLPEQPVSPPEPTAEQAPAVIDNGATETTAAPEAPATAAPTAEAPAAPAVIAPEQAESGSATATPTEQQAAPVVAAPEPQEPVTAPAAPKVTMDQPLPPAGASAEPATGATPVPETTVPEPAAPAQQAASAQEPAPAATQEAAVASTGDARVQLAAGKSEDAVKKEWARLQQAHPKLLGSLSLTVQRVDKGTAGIFYRLQAGPLADAAAARQLCASLKQ